MKSPQTTRKLCIEIVRRKAEREREKPSQSLNKALLLTNHRSLVYLHLFIKKMYICMHISLKLSVESQAQKIVVAMILTQFQTSIAGQG